MRLGGDDSKGRVIGRGNGNLARCFKPLLKHRLAIIGSPEHAVERGRVNVSADRDAALDQSDVDREVSAALDEFLCAVERVNQKEPLRALAFVRRCALFCDDGGVRKGRLERRDDNTVGGEVGLGHWRVVVLGAGFEVGVIDIHNRGAGLAAKRKEKRFEGGKGQESYSEQWRLVVSAGNGACR